MGNFHRFVDPAYFLFGGESFPGSSPGSVGGHTYYRANVVSGGTGGSGSANAEPQKSGGNPNDGTFWVAFGEDGTSGNTNRGFKALTENTDVIDDILRTSVPKWVRTLVTNPAANSYQVSGDVFVGDTASPGLTAAELVSISDANGRKLFSGTSAIAVTAIDDGTPGNSVIGNGWYTDPTIRFSGTINENFYLTVGARTSNARIVEQEREAIWKGLMTVQGWGVQGNTSSLKGLDEAYRRSTGISSTSPTPDTPGSGRLITRDGLAVEVQPVVGDWTASRQPDPYLAMFIAGHRSIGYTSHTPAYGGDIGFVAFSSQRFAYNDAGELTTSDFPLSGYCVFNPREVGSSVSGQTAYTSIKSTSNNAVLNSLSGGADRIKLNSPYYFRSGGNTAIQLGRDLLVVTFVDSTQQAYRIWDFVADDEVEVRTLGGASPSFSADTTVTVEWVQMLFAMGGAEDINGAQDSRRIPAFGYWAPPPLSAASLENPPDTLLHMPPEFISASPGSSYDGGTLSGYAVQFGFHDRATGLPQYSGYITGGGTFSFTWGEQRGSFLRRYVFIPAAPGSTDLYINPYKRYDGTATQNGETYQFLDVHFVGPISVAATLNITSVVETTGGEFVMMMVNDNGADATVNWSSDFVFSGNDADPPLLPGQVVKYVGHCSSTSPARWYMTRTDY